MHKLIQTFLAIAENKSNKKYSNIDESIAMTEGQK